MRPRAEYFQGGEAVLCHLGKKFRRQFARNGQIGGKDSLHALSPVVLLGCRRPLVSHGRTLVAGVCRAETFSSCNVDSNRVYEPNVSDFSRRVAHCRQRVLHLRRNLILHHDAVWEPLMMETRRVDSRLRFHS